MRTETSGENEGLDSNETWKWAWARALIVVGQCSRRQCNHRKWHTLSEKEREQCASQLEKESRIGEWRVKGSIRRVQANKATKFRKREKERERKIQRKSLVLGSTVQLSHVLLPLPFSFSLFLSLLFSRSHSHYSNFCGGERTIEKLSWAEWIGKWIGAPVVGCSQACR